MPETLRNYVGGSFLAGAGDPFDDINPSDATDLVARVPGGNADDAGAAVRAAGQALATWRDLPGPARAEFLYRWAEVIAARGEELAQAMAREVGKPLGEARGEMARCSVILRYYAGEAVRASGEVVPAQAAACCSSRCASRSGSSR